MTTQDWEIFIGVAVAMVLAIGPWMFQVHAKLAVIASKLTDISEELKNAEQERRRLWDLQLATSSQIDQHQHRLDVLYQQPSS